MSPSRLRNIARNALTFISLSATAACTAGDTAPPGPAYTVEFTSSMLTFTSMNDAQTVTVTVRDNKGVSIPDATVDWDSENPSIATVSGGGRTVQINGVQFFYEDPRHTLRLITEAHRGSFEFIAQPRREEVGFKLENLDLPPQ